MTAAWLLPVAATAATAGHEVVVGVDPAGGCHVTFDGAVFPTGDDAASVRRLRSMAGGVRRAIVRSDPANGGNVPYRCIGAAIYQLQRAGYELKFALVGGPVP